MPWRKFIHQTSKVLYWTIAVIFFVPYLTAVYLGVPYTWSWYLVLAIILATLFGGVMVMTSEKIG